MTVLPVVSEELVPSEKKSVSICQVSLLYTDDVDFVVPQEVL